MWFYQLLPVRYSSYSTPGAGTVYLGEVSPLMTWTVKNDWVWIVWWNTKNKTKNKKTTSKHIARSGIPITRMWKKCEDGRTVDLHTQRLKRFNPVARSRGTETRHETEATTKKRVLDGVCEKLESEGRRERRFKCPPGSKCARFFYK